MKLSTSLYVQKLKIRNRVFLAPMSGVSDLPFRQLAWRHGAGLVISEMVASKHLCQQARGQSLRLSGKGVGLHVVQLLGRDPYWLGQAAAIAVDSGAQMIDFNLGCPARKVVEGACGSALLRELPVAFKAIEAIIKAVNVPVSVKTRLGWEEGELSALPLAKEAQNLGISMFTLHARSRTQFYTGQADWAKAAPIAEILKIPLIINGDISDKSSAEKALRAAKADAIMIGRAACGAPWLLGEIAYGSTAFAKGQNLADLLFEHYEMMREHYGIIKGQQIARKHIQWYLEKQRPTERAFSNRDIYFALENSQTASERERLFRKIFA